MAEEQSPLANDVLSVHVTIKDLKPLELTFFKTDTVNEVFQTIEVIPEVHHFTNYNLLYQSKSLDPTTLLADLLSSVKQKTLQFELKPKPYNGKSILDHVHKIRDIVGLAQPETFGLNSGVSKINDLNLGPIPDAKVKEEAAEKKEEEKQKPASVPEPTAEEAAQIPDIVNNFFGKLPSNYYTPSSLIQPAVRGLYLSSWNPVPLNFRAKSHLIYLNLQTLEGETFHITGSTTGFFINKSSSNKFDPLPRENPNTSFTLYDLIAKTSKNFVSQIKANNEKLEKIDPITFLRPQTSFLSNPWITKSPNPIPDFGKTQFEEKVQRDFNDEYQSIKDFPTQTLSDRIIRERFLAKTSFEFTENAVKGALEVLNGAIQPMNPTENELDQIFLYNGIFYSFGVDASGVFESKGGNNAARAAASQDLKAIKYWNTIDSRGIYTLLTTIVDFAGRRVVCQAPVPGLFTSSEPKETKNEETGEKELIDGEPLTQIDYGYDETSDSFKSNPAFVKGLEEIRKAIHFKNVKKGDNEAVTNSEVKGMFGTDKRKYVIDLYNTTPLDVEFKDEHYKPDNEDSYPHRQVVIRLEAVQEWWTQKAKALVKEEAEKKGLDLSAPLKEGEEPPSVTIDDEMLMFTPDQPETDANVRAVSKFIKSDLIPRFLDQYDSITNIAPTDGAHLSSTLHKFGINIRYLGYVAKQIEAKIAESEKAEKELLEENVKVNKEVEEKIEARHKKIHKLYEARTEAMKKGEEPPADDLEQLQNEEDEIDENLDAKPVSKSVQFQFVYHIVIQELIARASKHILRDFSQSLPLTLVPSLVSHFHNCLIGSGFNNDPTVVVENRELYSEDELEFTKLSPQSVQNLIAKYVKIWYRYDLPSDWNVKYVNPLQLQREIALKFGIQWQQRDYYFSKESFEEAKKLTGKDKKVKKSKSASPAPVEKLNVFEPEDVSFAPLIKDAINGSTAAEQIFEAGRQDILNKDESKREEGLALIAESLAVYEQVYGQVHPEVGRVYATLSQLYQEIGLKREATLSARRAVAVHERTSGLDSHDTLVALLNLAYLEVESGSILNSLKVYGLLTQIWNSIFDSQHVSIPTVVANSTLYLQGAGLVKESRKILEKLTKLSVEVHGEQSYATGFLKFRYAYVLAQEEKFDDAHNEAQVAHEILRNAVSEKHYLANQARILVTQLTKYKLIQKENQKVEKQKLKSLVQENQQNAKINSNKNTLAGPNKKFEAKSVDEVLDYVLGNTSSSSKKNKKKNKKQH